MGSTVKVFLWWFIVGAIMALAVIMVQGGIREVMQAPGSVWELKLVELLTTIDHELPLDPISRAKFRLPASEGSLIHLLHERARVLASRYDGDCCEIEAETPESVKRRLARYIAE